MAGLATWPARALDGVWRNDSTASIVEASSPNRVRANKGGGLYTLTHVTIYAEQRRPQFQVSARVRSPALMLQAEHRA